MRFYTLLNHTYFILTWSLLVTGEDGWTLLWSDEFDQDGFLNSSVWTPRTGFLGYNGEFQTYTDSPENLRVEGGKLHITALKSSQGYTSARINTMNKLKTKYSMIEASIKIPPMQIGLWPAMWTLGDSYSQGVPWPASG